MQVTSAFTLRPCAPSTLPTATNSNETPSGTKWPEPYFAVPSITLEQAWHFTLRRIVSAIYLGTMRRTPALATNIPFHDKFTGV